VPAGSILASPEDVPAVVTLRPGHVLFVTPPTVVTTVGGPCVPATTHCARPGAGRLPGAPVSAGAAPVRDDGRGERP